MDVSFDLPDSTDWLTTSIPALEPLEAALRCEVCKEFYTNPVITTCSHTFCSICIRRCIASDSKCPSCKNVCSSDKLTPNIVVREVVLRFQEARPKTLELARADKQDGVNFGNVKKRKLDETDIEEEPARQTRSRQTRSHGQRSQGTSDAPMEVADSEGDDDEEFLLEGLAKCPICGKPMKPEQVYNHLDVCPGPDASQGRNTRSKTKFTFPATLQQRQKEQSPPPTRLSQLNYAMLKETALRKKLQDIGLPTWGNKDLLKRRHIEWLNIYNSNCDAGGTVRKSKKQLLKELDEWENTQGGNASNKESKIMRKDFDGDGYAKSHKSDFDDLIARARQKRAAPKADEEDSTKSESHTPQPSSDPLDHSRLRITHPSTGTDPLTHQSLHNHGSRSHHPPPNPHNPYENNESALASIRAKVEEANHPSAKHSSLSNELSMESARRRGSTHSEGMLNPFGSPSRKVPMFKMPAEPVKDTDSTAVQ